MTTLADVNIDWSFYGEPPVWLGGFRKAAVRSWFDAFGKQCKYCPRIMSNDKRHRGKDRQATIDHIVPKAHGGDDSLSNLQIICRKCNTRKGNGWLEFRTDGKATKHAWNWPGHTESPS